MLEGTAFSSGTDFVFLVDEPQCCRDSGDFQVLYARCTCEIGTQYWAMDVQKFKAL